MILPGPGDLYRDPDDYDSPCSLCGSREAVAENPAGAWPVCELCLAEFTTCDTCGGWLTVPAEAVDNIDRTDFCSCHSGHGHDVDERIEG